MRCDACQRRPEPDELLEELDFDELDDELDLDELDEDEPDDEELDDELEPAELLELLDPGVPELLLLEDEPAAAELELPLVPGSSTPGAVGDSVEQPSIPMPASPRLPESTFKNSRRSSRTSWMRRERPEGRLSMK